MSWEEQSNPEGEVIPLGILLVGLVIGGYFVTSNPTSGNTAYISWVFIGFSVLGIIYVTVGFRNIYNEEGLDPAVRWLFGTYTEDHRRAASSGTTTQSKTPPPPERLKNELYFDRANRECEWCEKQVDSPDVHHIQPRAEGGSNDPDNLIVLCPNCHRKADGGAISRAKLTYRVNEQMEKW